MTGASSSALGGKSFVATAEVTPHSLETAACGG
eukprot:CAMPEP_0172695438 /NCGR_PEP_ID=MMETSP1074-20121228/27358_1 /TAXON_ID=2916 /ORGANISM="Ceratium fusus, Strain PA161109" /LENGTH=32 /DNA_ID= /DNA_START= /DNA_END= /DNA_ORIENTATION=